MVRPDVARARVSRAVVWLTDASSIVERPASEFVAATKDRDLAIFYLFLTIQECMDLAAHWVADAGWAPQTTPVRHSTCWPSVAPSTEAWPTPFVSGRASRGLRLATFAQRTAGQAG